MSNITITTAQYRQTIQSVIQERDKLIEQSNELYQEASRLTQWIQKIYTKIADRQMVKEENELREEYNMALDSLESDFVSKYALSSTF